MKGLIGDLLKEDLYLVVLEQVEQVAREELEKEAQKEIVAMPSLG